MAEPRVKDVMAWIEALAGPRALEAAERLEGLPQGWLEEHSLPRKRVAPLVPGLARVLEASASPLVQQWCAQIIAEIPMAEPEVVRALRWGLLHGHSTSIATMVYAIGTLGPSAKDAVPELVARASSSDLEVRWRVAWALDRIGARDPTVAASLRPLLKDAFSTARGYAASAYAKAVGFDATLLSDLEPLLDDPDPFPRAEASQALAKGRGA